MKFSTIFFDIDYCIMDTPTSERRIIRDLDAGQITRERLYVMRFERLFEMYPFKDPAEKVAPWFLDQLAHAYDPQEGAEHLLRRLHENGVKVFTASNGIGKVMNGRVENAGLSKYLTGRFAADEVGAMKPSQRRNRSFPHPDGGG